MDFNTRRTRILTELAKVNYLEAIPQARSLLTDNPGSAEANYLLARSLTESGNPQTAIEYAQIACDIDKLNFQYLFYCGSLYDDFNLHEMALPYFQQSVALQPNACLSQLALANCYYSIAQGEKALGHYRSALKLSPPPDVKDDIRFQLAICLNALDKNDEAEKLFRRLADSVGSKQVFALCKLVTISDAAMDSDLYSRLQGFANDNNRSWQERRACWLAIGKINQSDKLFDQAFLAWEQAANLGKNATWIPRDHQKQFAELTAFYTADLFAECLEYGSDSSSPIFLAGMPRSGTTMTEQIVAAHSRAAAVGERGRWRDLDLAFRARYSDRSNLKNLVADAKSGQLRARAEQALVTFKNIAVKPANTFVDKLAHNFVYAGYQALIFPKARFIHLRRHPADTFISSYENNFNQSHPYTFDQVEYVKEYAFHENLMAHWKSIFGDRVITVQYEQLVTNPDFEARRILKFADLDWENQCLDFYKKKSTVRTFSAQQVRQPVYTHSINRWHKYKQFLAPLFNTMDEMGLTYPPKD